MIIDGADWHKLRFGKPMRKSKTPNFLVKAGHGNLQNFPKLRISWTPRNTALRFDKACEFIPGTNEWAMN